MDSLKRAVIPMMFLAEKRRHTRDFCMSVLCVRKWCESGAKVEAYLRKSSCNPLKTLVRKWICESGCESGAKVRKSSCKLLISFAKVKVGHLEAVTPLNL